MTLAAILPMAFVMIAGPQIISSFFFATSKHWGKNSLSYLTGGAISVTAFVSAAYFVDKGAASAANTSSDHGTAGTVLTWVILGLVLALIGRVYATRKTSQPPKWMSRLQDAQPRFAFVLGLLLLGIFPTDIMTSVTAGLYIARHGGAWWECLPFVGVTLLLLGLPALGVAVLGQRAQVVLPKARDWMNDNSWVVSEIVLFFFAAISINSLVSG